MALRLRVISDHRHRMGDKSTFVFGVSGGSIGRSAENDWVLPDDMRYVSGRHARIVFHKGRYLLQDTSSNGTYVNDNERPLGNQNPHELKSGDVLRIGEYHVQVQIDSATDFSLDDSALYHTGSTSTRRRKPPPPDLGASLRLENLLEASNDTSSDELKPVNAFGQAVSARTRALHQTQDLPKEPSDRARARRRLPTPSRAASRVWRAPPKNRRRRAQQPAPSRCSPRACAFPARARQHSRPAGVLPRRRHRRRDAARRRARAHAAPRGPAAARMPLGSQGEQPLPAGSAQPAARDVPEGPGRFPAFARAPQHRGADPGTAQGARQPPFRRGAVAARNVRARAQARRRDDRCDARARSSTSSAGSIRATSPRASSAAPAARRWATGSSTASSTAACAKCQPNTLPHIFVETFAQQYDQAAREGEEGSAHSIDAA